MNAEDRVLNYRKVCSCVNQGYKSPPDLFMFVDIEQINRELKYRVEHKKYIERVYGFGRKLQELRTKERMQNQG